MRIGNFPKLLPSKNYVDWEKLALLETLPTKQRLKMDGLTLPILGPVNVRLTVWRDANRGDACGYYQAAGDFLQKAGIIKNDEQIKAWDGSRLRVDRLRPRLDIEITNFDEESS